MKVVAGLGNPGKKYDNTPHNIGFNVVDLLAEKLSASWKNHANFRVCAAKTTWKGTQLLLVKPQTFMNLSGTGIAPLMRYYRCTPEDLTVVIDDADLPLGRLRIRAKGGSGGHNGLASVITHLGTEEFARVRVGVGRETPGGLIRHVLNRFTDKQSEMAANSVVTAAKAVLCLLENGLTESMNRYNGWQYEAGPDPE
ncbi:MAG: aminoacyl-tRNA hydrolase [Kiritimatiellia bacterium]